MITYIKWDKLNDENFRADYQNEVGESLQVNPQENPERTHYIVGSSRITSANQSNLSQEGVQFSEEPFEVFVEPTDNS